MNNEKRKENEKKRISARNSRRSRNSGEISPAPPDGERGGPPLHPPQTEDGLPRFGKTDFASRGEYTEFALMGKMTGKFDAPNEKYLDAIIHSKDLEKITGLVELETVQQLIQRFFKSVWPSEM